MTQFIPVLFGTETGNAADCADSLAIAITGAGFPAKSIDLYDFDCEELGEQPLVFIVSSTHGNGDPPENAEEMMEFLKHDGPDLENVRFAVCGLGDTAYPYFAQCGKDFDKYMEENGAQRILPRVDCDESFEVPFAQFKEAVLQYLNENADVVRSILNLSDDAEPATAAATAVSAEVSAPQLGTLGNPSWGTLKKKRKLSQEGSNKETMHYEIDLRGSGISYVAGDCIGVFPKNNPKEVGLILEAAGLSGSEHVSWNGKELSLRSLLEEKACLQQITVDFLTFLAQQNPLAKQAIDGGAEAMTSYINSFHILDALQQAPISMDAQTFASHLQKIKARLYSIASSPNKHQDEVHFCIETLRYRHNERATEGVASTWFADRLAINSPISLYLHTNKRFRLPQEHVPVIMIGPGTGIAPFVAFLQEKESLNFGGEMWLFFGHQHEKKDYLYQEELQQAQANGTLNRLDLAWSRDQKEKVYVQHKLWEHRSEIWDWYKRGAVFYVCGDARRMALDVDAMLRKIAEENGESGDAWIAYLEANNRYQRDVY